jgi:hypothetical protein
MSKNKKEWYSLLQASPIRIRTTDNIETNFGKSKDPKKQITKIYTGTTCNWPVSGIFSVYSS